MFPWILMEEDETIEEFQKRCEKIWEYTFSKEGLIEAVNYFGELAKEIDRKLKEKK